VHPRDTGARLSIVVIDTHSEVRSTINSLDSWKPPKEYITSDGTLGWEREGAITLPATLKEPGAVLVRKLADEKNGKSQDYIDCIQLVRCVRRH
jgi:linoleate 9S-lipoxygenase